MFALCCEWLVGLFVTVVIGRRNYKPEKPVPSIAKYESPAEVHFPEWLHLFL